MSRPHRRSSETGSCPPPSTPPTLYLATILSKNPLRTYKPECQTQTISECILWFATCGSSQPDSERERQATIARNRELLAQLGLADAASAIKSTKQANKAAKPVQPRVKKPKEPAMPTRQSTRLGRAAQIDPNETPQQKRKREVRPHFEWEAGTCTKQAF